MVGRAETEERRRQSGMDSNQCETYAHPLLAALIQLYQKECMAVLRRNDGVAEAKAYKFYQRYIPPDSFHPTPPPPPNNRGPFQLGFNIKRFTL